MNVKTTESSGRTRSPLITNSPERSPHRAMLRTLGYTDEGFRMPFVGIANALSTTAPSNSPLPRLVDQAEKPWRESGLLQQTFWTPVVSDAISMGTFGKEHCLVSPEGEGRVIGEPRRGHGLNLGGDLSPVSEPLVSRPVESGARISKEE